MWLVGRDDDVIGQIIMVLKVKKNKERKRKMFSKINCG